MINNLIPPIKKTDKGKYKNSENARVVDTYDLLTNNCTTKSSEAIDVGTNGKVKLNSSTPDGVDTKLNNQSNDKNSNIRKVPYKTIQDEYKK